MPPVTRRTALVGAAAALAAPALVRAQSLGGGARVVVVGAGVFGAWTAEYLRRAGTKVLLLDAWGPAHARASSGGESRMTRAAYGRDEVYTRMALDSLAEWKALSARSELPLFHPHGVLFFASGPDAQIADSAAVHRRLGLPSEVLTPAEMRRRFPQIDFTGVTVGIYEPQFGALMARRAVQELVASYIPTGGLYEREAVLPPIASGNRLRAVRTRSGRTIEADAFVFACGPWLPKLFPALLGRRIFPTRQEIFFFAPEPGDNRYLPDRFPGWADFNNGDVYYGFPDLEARGFKIAHDAHGPPIDPDLGDRVPSTQALADVRAFMARRFPALAGRPLSEARVCQYENSANGDFLIDRHPQMANLLLVGGGSGHGFKHGPAVGRYAAELSTGKLVRPEPRFSLATKGETQRRDVH
jgi:monomeric sarcosine oxidase